MNTIAVQESPPRDPCAPGNEILRGGMLAGLDPEALASRFGTPLYVYDLDVITRQVEALRRVLPRRFELAYAVKANPALAIVAHLADLGLGADVASGGELVTALQAGTRREAVVFTGPGKRDNDLRSAARAGIRAITVESLRELARLEAIAAELGTVVPVLLRAGAEAGARPERVRLIGDDGAGKFGMGADDLWRAARTAAESRHVDLLGVDAFGASNVLDAGAIARHVAWTVELSRNVCGEADLTPRLVDVGGGLGIPYEPHEEPLDLADLGARLRTLDDIWGRDPLLRGTRIVLEPGRFLVGPAGAYLGRVVDVKERDGRAVAILDGGMHHLSRPAFVGQEHRVRLVSGARDGRACAVTIAGPLCAGRDVFAPNAAMPVPDVGDLVAVLDVGAYGFSESMLLFLSHPTPAEVAVKAGRAQLIRPPLEPAAVLAAQRRPAW